MSYLLDTCFISELRKPQPNKSTLAWFEKTDERLFYLSVLSVGELAYGISLLSDGQKKEDLQKWLDTVQENFSSHLIQVDEPVCRIWGEIRAKIQMKGLTIPVVDGLLAATCLCHDLILVTRNMRDFSSTGVKIINPWDKDDS